MAEIITDENIITTIYEDPGTGIKLAEDTLGKFYLLPTEQEISAGVPFYLNASVSSPWVNNTTFQDIPGVTYVTASGFQLEFIMATSDKETNNVVGVFKDNVLLVSIPFGYDLNFQFPNPLRFDNGEELKVKFKPPLKRTKLVITVGGKE